MKNIILFLTFILIYNLSFSQKNNLYILIDDNEIYTKKIHESDTLELMYFQLKKVLPKEKFKYQISLNQFGEIEKILPGTLSWGNENLIKVIAKFSGKVLKKDINQYKSNLIYSHEIPDIKFKS